MVKPDECLEEYIHLTNKECKIAIENKDDIKNKGASFVNVHKNDSDMDANRVHIWGQRNKKLRKLLNITIN